MCVDIALINLLERGLTYYYCVSRMAGEVADLGSKTKYSSSSSKQSVLIVQSYLLLQY